MTRLDPEVVDEHDRWGRRCATNRCVEPVTHQTSYRYVTGRAGRVWVSQRRVCADHAAAFARRHQVEIGPAPARPEPRPVDALLPAYLRAELRHLRGHPASQWWLSLERAGGGGSTSWPVPEFAVPNDAGLEEAIHAAEVLLARSRMLVPAAGWQRTGGRAAATLLRWSTRRTGVVSPGCAPWPAPRMIWEGPTWTLERQLSAEFEPVKYPLGHTGMDLGRAVRTAERLLERTGWTLAGQWSSSGQVATVHAHPPARPTLTRPAPASAATFPSRLARPPAGRPTPPLPAASR